MRRRSWCALLTDRLKVKCVSINCLYARVAAKKISINKLWFIFQFNTESHYILENNRESLVWSMRVKQKIAIRGSNPFSFIYMNKAGRDRGLASSAPANNRLFAIQPRQSLYFLTLTVHCKNPLNLWFSAFFVICIHSRCISIYL